MPPTVEITQTVLTDVVPAMPQSPAEVWTLGLILQLAVSSKVLVGGVFVLGVFALAFRLRQPNAVLLAAWTFCLTYNRHYFSFASFVGYHGFQGPYWIVSDIFFVALFGLWIGDVLVGRKSPARAGPIWPWYLPFFAACLLSSLVAVHPEWALFEMIRVTKVALIFLYTRYRLGETEWWACIVGLGAALAAQSLLAVAQSVIGVGGVLSLFGAGGEIETPPGLEQGLLWRRPSGTMNHPPRLSCYLLLTFPVFLALGLSWSRTLLRGICLGTGAIGLIGLVISLTRFAWLLAAAQIAGLLVFLVVTRMLTAKRMIGVTVVGTLVVALAITPLTGALVERLTGDFERSVDARLTEMRIALTMFYDANPLLGVGLNNYKAYLDEYDPDAAVLLEGERTAVEVHHVRYPIGPWQGFLMLLTETGLLGLTTFVIYLVGVLIIGVRAIAASSSYRRAANAGLLLGLLGVLGHQITDHSYWVDPILYTFTLIVAMLRHDASEYGKGITEPVRGELAGARSALSPAVARQELRG